MGINLRRKLFHASFGLLLLLTSYLLSEKVFKGFLIFLFFGISAFEFFRLRFKNFSLFRWFWGVLLKKEEEKRLTDAWFYVLGINVCFWLVPVEVFRLILSILSFADPVAAVIGFYLGKHRPFTSRSLEGSLSFLLVSLLLFKIFLHKLNLLGFAFCLTGTLVEHFVKRDNLWLPLSLGLAWNLLTKFNFTLYF